MPVRQRQEVQTLPRNLGTTSKRAVKFAVVPGGDISLVVTPILTFPHRGEGTIEIVS